jgi:hypothetical protein
LGASEGECVHLDLSADLQRCDRDVAH